MRITLDGWTWALLFARWVLGLTLLMAGFAKVFDVGVTEHARQAFVEALAGSWIPAWLLWAAGTIAPVVELLTGALLCIGFRVRGACITVGVLLVVATFGLLLAEPGFSLTDQIFPRLLLLLFILASPRDRDESSLDYWIELRRDSRPPG